MKTAIITKAFPKLPEILARVEIMERTTTDAEDNCGLMLVESDVLFEKLGGYSLQFTIQDMINTTVDVGNVASSKFKTEKEAITKKQEMDSLLILMTNSLFQAFR